METPSIEKYLLSTCLFTIDEFNEMYKSLSKNELKEIADTQYNEMDICVRIGDPFKNIHYTVGDGNKNRSKSNHDLYLKSKDFKIEIKYLKNWKSESGTKSSSKNWKEYQIDFDWLEQELKENNGKRAFVIGWFNCVDKFSQLMQLGDAPGSRPLVDEKKLVYFPFLKRLSIPTYTQDLIYNYKSSYEEKSIEPIGEKYSNMKCMFLGNEADKFHFAIYY